MVQKKAKSGPYDIVRTNSRVVDLETYLEDPMHVGIKDDRIVAVSETPLEVEEVIDFSGMIVAPGLNEIKSSAYEMALLEKSRFTNGHG